MPFLLFYIATEGGIQLARGGQERTWGDLRQAFYRALLEQQNEVIFQGLHVPLDEVSGILRYGQIIHPNFDKQITLREWMVVSRAPESPPA